MPAIQDTVRLCDTAEAQDQHVPELAVQSTNRPPRSSSGRGLGRSFRQSARGLSVIASIAGVALLFAVAGCAKSDATTDQVATLDKGTTPGTVASSATNEQKLRDYAKCMRDHGIPTFPDPVVDANGQPNPGNMRAANIDRESQAFTDANNACKALRAGVGGGGGFNNVDRTKLQDGALKYAQCLRDKGLTVKDPQLGQAPTGGPPGGGAGQGGPPDNAGQAGRGGRGAGFIARALGLDENDPAVQGAQTACQPVLQQMLKDAGIGQGGPGGPGGGAPAGAG